MEENRFIDSFRAFIREYDVPFTERESSFLFPQNKLEIKLLTSEALPIQSLRNKCTPQESLSYIPELPVPLPEQNQLSFSDILYLYQDRWFAAPEVTRQRIAARLGKFKSLFARKCKLLTTKEWLQLEKENPPGSLLSETDFLNRYHAYGHAASKYRYALLWENEIVAVATFSPPRPMLRQLADPLRNLPPEHADSLWITDRPALLGAPYEPNEAAWFRSYEWIRYASLPGVRVVGGMGRLLQAFLREVAHPDNPRFATMPIEVMSYSDNEWSGGEVYETLGFFPAGEREAVEYYVDRTTYERLSARKLRERYARQHPAGAPAGEKRTAAPLPPPSFLENYYRITNQGSRKFLLQSTAPFK